MVYRPRYLDKKRNESIKKQPVLINTRIEQSKLILGYSNGYQLICKKKIIECYDSDGKLKWWFGADGRGEIF